MMKKVATTGLFGLTLLIASTAWADHNSPHGAGWAKMPNDIHNTRIETLGGDSGSFTSFVRYGNGADSVNRYADDSNGQNRTMNKTRSRMRNRVHAGNGGTRGGGGGRR